MMSARVHRLASRGPPSLVLADGPRPVDLHDDFAAVLRKRAAAQKFFETLSNNLQRYHVDHINGAKTADTRQRRIERAINLFLDGTPR